jgi:hypothetical protein
VGNPVSQSRVSVEDMTEAERPLLTVHAAVCFRPATNAS